MENISNKVPYGNVEKKELSPKRKRVLMCVICILSVALLIFAVKFVKGTFYTSKSVIRYMEKRYNDNFTLLDTSIDSSVGWWGELGPVTAHNFVLRSEKYPERDVLVKIYGWNKWYDNYPVAKYYSETMSALKEIAVPIYGEETIISFDTFPPNKYYKPKMGFDEFFSTCICEITISTTNTTITKDEDALKLVDTFKQNSVSIRIIILRYFYSYNDMIARDNVNLKQLYGYVYCDENYRITEKKWYDGKEWFN